MIEQFGSFARLFELNHVDPTKKDPNYENLIRRDISTEQLDEVDKCVLLCRNCHGIVHQQNINAKVIVHVMVEGRKMSQEFKGQLIRNHKERTCTFLTSDKFFLHPYRVSLGSDPPRLAFGLELRRGDLMNLMRQVSPAKVLRVECWRTRQVMLEVRCDEDQGIHVTQDLSFNVIDCELYKEKGDPIFLWIRNGIGLTREGEVIHNGLLTYQGRRHL